MSFTFDDIADLLLSSGSMLSPSELHGQLCGQLALGLTPSNHQWIRQVSDTTGVQIEAGSRIAEELVEWLQFVQHNIADIDLGFELFLPSEEEGLIAVSEELATWCAGFMTGVAMVNAQTKDSSYETDTEELFGDIVAISSLDADSAADAEETDLDQLIQHVRLGVAQLCQDTIKKHQPADQDVMH